MNSGASKTAVEQAAMGLKISFPQDYIDFLLEHDGGEGFLGENYLILWRAVELVDFNREYEVKEYAPGLVLFGSNGGGEAYAFDIRSAAAPIVQVPFIGMDLKYARAVGSTFSDFLDQLSK